MWSVSQGKFFEVFIPVSSSRNKKGLLKFWFHYESCLAGPFLHIQVLHLLCGCHVPVLPLSRGFRVCLQLHLELRNGAHLTCVLGHSFSFL